MKNLNLKQNLKQTFSKFKPSDKRTTPPKHNLPPHHGQPLGHQPNPFDKRDKDSEW